MEKEESYASKFFKALKTPIHKIRENLFLGNRKYNYEILKEKDIKSVVRLSIDEYPTPNGEENIKYHIFTLDDRPECNILKLIPEILAIIEISIKDNENILVQCEKGASRSASFVIAYLMKVDYLTYEEAFRLVVNIRGCVKPNPGFVTQLEEYQKNLNIL